MTAPVPGRRLVLVRHGRTSWNAEGRAQGHADVGLDDTGRAQAQAMAPVLAGYEPALLVSSDLARARETAAFLERATGLDCRQDARLREYDVGERTGLTRAEYAAQVGDAAASAAFETHALAPVPGAESATAVARRFVPVLEEVLEELSAGGTAVLVTHGAALRIGVAAVLGWSPEASESLGVLPNCAWVVLGERPGARLRLSAYNRRAGG